MQLGDKKLIVQRASVGAKNSAVGQTAPVQIQVRNCYQVFNWSNSHYNTS